MTAARAVRALSAARRLSLADWAVLAEAWWELRRADRAVSRRPYAAWRDRVKPGTTPGAGAPRAIDPRLPRLLRAAARLRPQPIACLPRALALRAMLERRGHRVDVRFGARRDGDAIDAHAWLVADGVEIDTGADVAGRYEPLRAGAGGAP